MKKINLLLITTLFSANILAVDLETEQNNEMKVQTVDWYEKHETERKAMAKKCQNNPGELGETPTCKNVARANDNAYFKAPMKYDW